MNKTAESDKDLHVRICICIRIWTNNLIFRDSVFVVMLLTYNGCLYLVGATAVLGYLEDVLMQTICLTPRATLDMDGEGKGPLGR